MNRVDDEVDNDRQIVILDPFQPFQDEAEDLTDGATGQAEGGEAVEDDGGEGRVVVQDDPQRLCRLFVLRVVEYLGQGEDDLALDV